MVFIAYKKEPHIKGLSGLSFQTYQTAQLKVSILRHSTKASYCYGMMAHAFDHSTLKVDGSLCSQGQPGLHRESTGQQSPGNVTLSQKGIFILQSYNLPSNLYSVYY